MAGMKGFSCMYHWDIVQLQYHDMWRHMGAFCHWALLYWGDFHNFKWIQIVQLSDWELQQYWPSFLGIESKAFNSNFPFKHIPFENVQRNLFSQKKPLVLFFPKQQKMYKNYGLCMTKADNFFGYLFAWYIPDFPNSQISSNPPNCYQQCLVQMIYWHMAHQLHKWLSLANTWIIPRYNLRDMSSTYIEISLLLLQLKEIKKTCKQDYLVTYEI